MCGVPLHFRNPSAIPEALGRKLWKSFSSKVQLASLILEARKALECFAHTGRRNRCLASLPELAAWFSAQALFTLLLDVQREAQIEETGGAAM